MCLSAFPASDPGPRISKQQLRNKLIEHRNYVDRHGEDMPEIANWGWPYKTAARAGD
jgi:xylulose-5-phosphate/fructose-6-phosphate phosphoketolase